MANPRGLVSCLGLPLSVLAFHLQCPEQAKTTERVASDQGLGGGSWEVTANHSGGSC